MKAESNLEKVLQAGHFAVTGELGPPKSVDRQFIGKRVGWLKGAVDAANITDCQTAIVRMSSIAVGRLCLEEGLEPIIQITCRDRNRIAIQSDVLGAGALGIKNILCLTGDHQCFGNHPESKNVFDLDSVQLIQTLKNMRDKKVFLSGEEIRNGKNAPGAGPKIFIGGAANPVADPLAFRPVRLAKKVKAGVDFIQTQCIYDMEKFEEWMKGVRARRLHKKVYILAGVTPLKSAGMVKYMRDSVPGVSVPESVAERMAGAEDPKEEGLKICLEQIERFKKIEGVAGVHIMAIGWESKVKEIVERAGLLPRPKV